MTGLSSLTVGEKCIITNANGLKMNVVITEQLYESGVIFKELTPVIHKPREQDRCGWNTKIRRKL